MLDKWWPYVCLSPHRWPCIFTQEKKLSLALLPLPQSTLPAPSSSLPPSVFYSTSLFLPLLCRRFDIGNTVSALHGNNSGKDDINYLPIVWHMQGIVLAIIISTLSPEGMNGAIAALCFSAKLLGLFGASALLVKDIQCACLHSFKGEWITIRLLNCKASSTLAFAYVQKEKVSPVIIIVNIPKSIFLIKLYCFKEHLWNDIISLLLKHQ